MLCTNPWQVIGNWPYYQTATLCSHTKCSLEEENKCHRSVVMFLGTVSGIFQSVWMLVVPFGKKGVPALGVTGKNIKLEPVWKTLANRQLSPDTCLRPTVTSDWSPCSLPSYTNLISLTPELYLILYKLTVAAIASGRTCPKCFQWARSSLLCSACTGAGLATWLLCLLLPIGLIHLGCLARFLLLVPLWGSHGKEQGCVPQVSLSCVSSDSIAYSQMSFLAGRMTWLDCCAGAIFCS